MHTAVLGTTAASPRVSQDGTLTLHAAPERWGQTAAAAAQLLLQPQVSYR